MIPRSWFSTELGLGLVTNVHADPSQFTIIGDGFFAAARGDTATMQASTRQLNDVSARAGPETTDCRSSNPPTACISALDEASQEFLIASDGFNAAARLDTAGVQDAADRMDALSPSYQSDRDSCRGQAS